MLYRLLYPGNFLATEDLQGRDVTLHISRLVHEELATERGKERKWVLYFAELEEKHRKDPATPNRRLVLNKTCVKALAKLYGGETNDWISKPVTLFPTTCDAFGKKNTPCIRIKAPSKAKKAGGPTASDLERQVDDDTPASKPDLATEAAALAAHLDADPEPTP